MIAPQKTAPTTTYIVLLRNDRLLGRTVNNERKGGPVLVYHSSSSSLSSSTFLLGGGGGDINIKPPGFTHPMSAVLAVLLRASPPLIKPPTRQPIFSACCYCRRHSFYPCRQKPCTKTVGKKRARGMLFIIKPLSPACLPNPRKHVPPVSTL